MWTKYACVLAWSILMVILVAVGMKGSVRPAQANIRTASITTELTLASTTSVATALVSAPRPAARYVVQPGDTLSEIAARFAVRGGWPALYAANQSLIGPDPNLIRPGTVLVLPGQTAPARYMVAAGDTLAGIAAALAVPGGWPALYAANRRVIGADPNVIRAGAVLVIPGSVAPSPSAPSRGRPRYPEHPPTGGRHLSPPKNATPTATGTPTWLEPVLVVGLLIGAALLAEPLLPMGRRRRRRAAAAGGGLYFGGSGQEPGSGQAAAGATRIVVADHDRLVVTRSTRDDTVYVLRRPGEDPRAILRLARLVLPEGTYGELATQLGVPADWPME